MKEEKKKTEIDWQREEEKAVSETVQSSIPCTRVTFYNIHGNENERAANAHHIK